ncbi:hypothetical protein CR969_01440, partial [Candidatus Saccharibacteria bacterium]
MSKYSVFNKEVKLLEYFVSDSFRTEHPRAKDVDRLLNKLYDLTDNHRLNSFSYLMKGVGSSSRAKKIISFYLLGALCNPPQPEDDPEIIKSATRACAAEALKPDCEDLILEAILYSFIHDVDSVEAYPAISKAMNHNNNYIRLLATKAMGAHLNDEFLPEKGLKQLIEATDDKYAEIRDWAIFNLAQMVDIYKVKRPDIRQAFIKHARDRYYPAREEALVGLSYLKDPEGLEYL